jgi:hypothetical protein
MRGGPKRGYDALFFATPKFDFFIIQTSFSKLSYNNYNNIQILLKKTINYGDNIFLSLSYT